MAISMSNFVSKICYYSESSKCDTQYPFGYGYIMQKDEMGNCVWVEGDLFRFTHLFILFWKYNLFISILEYKPLKLYKKYLFKFFKRDIFTYMYIPSIHIISIVEFLRLKQKTPILILSQINMHFMLAITGCNYCGRRKTSMYSWRRK